MNEEELCSFSHCVTEMALAKSHRKEMMMMPKHKHKRSKSMLLPGTSLAAMESLSMPLIQEVVISADIRCSECQKRVADVISRMKDTDSMSVNLLEKKVTLTCNYPPGKETWQVSDAYRNSICKFSMIKRIFHTSRR